MSHINGPSVITDGLIFYADAANRKSNIKKTNNLIDNSSWTTTGYSTLPWPSNGDAAQNELLFDSDPWGNSSLVLKTHPNNPYANGGWEGAAPGYWVSIDNSKKYRFCVWMRRTSSNSNGYCYQGLHTNGTGDIIQSDGSTNTNPYWACQNIGYLTQNVWYLQVGHIFPYGSTPTVDPTSGYWTASGTYVGNPGCNITGYDPRFPSDATLVYQRCYHYYANDSASNLELFWPRIDLCDGTEPSIQEILNNGASQWKNLISSSYNGSLSNPFPGYDSSYGGGFTFNGSSNYISGGNLGSLSDFTVEIWFKSDSVSNYRNPIDCNWLVYNGSYSNIGPRLEQNSSGNLAWIFGDSSGNYESRTLISSGMSSTPVHCAVITKSGITVNAYYNGSLTASASATYTHPGTFSNVQIGRGFSTSGERWFSGKIYSVRIYNRALSDNEVFRNFNSNRGRYGL